MELAQYRQKVKAQNRNAVIGILIWAVICIFGFVCEAGDILIPVGGDSHWASRWHGFISGLSFSFLAILVASLVLGVRALKDEKALKKAYIRETDERCIQITTSAQAAAMKVFLMLGLAACVISGYFSMTISVTILACLLIHCLIGVGFKLYYSRKF